MQTKQREDAQAFAGGPEQAMGGIPALPSGAQAQTYEITVDGQAIALTLPQLLQAAQEGLSKVNRTARLQNTASALPEGEIYAAFLTEYPDVAPEEIPQEVWEQAAREGSLVAAYRAYELRQLRADLEALRQNQENQKSRVGSALSDGEATESDPVVRALFGR